MRFPWTRKTPTFKPGDRVISIETAVFKALGLKPKPGTVRGERDGIILVQWDKDNGAAGTKGYYPIAPTEIVHYLPHKSSAS